MNAAHEKNKIVELSELVSQPECLKLLILHTPFTLNIQALPLCLNLVKLDLSRNNLAAFPYLGELQNLRFIYIHENKLDVKAMIGIFEEDQAKEEKSPLSKVVLWVTYWGNKNQFQARHYLANHTSALAVDGHMIVPEERNPALILNRTTIPPFSEATEIIEILESRKKFNKNATEDEYMKQFWDDIFQLRKKQRQINPILKIQRVFRGWSFRNSVKNRELRKREQKILIRDVFDAWVRQHRYEKKLKAILTKKQKQYLLLPLKQMNLIVQKNKVLKYARQAKMRVFLRRSLCSNQHKFVNALKAHWKLTQSLYRSLYLSESNSIYVHEENYVSFQKFVIPFVERMNPGLKLQIEQNHNVLIRDLYADQKHTKEFLRILNVNDKTISYMRRLRPLERLNENNQALPKIFQSIFKCKSDLKKLYSSRNVHFSLKQRKKMEKIQEDFQKNRRTNLSELTEIIGNQRVLRDVVRGIYFYNLGHLTQGNRPQRKIDFLSEYYIRRISSVLTIQRIWKGFCLRKKSKDIISEQYTRNRAAVKIQKWIRDLRWRHRRDFIFEQGRYLKVFGNNYFYIKMNDYLQIVKEDHSNPNEQRMTFHEQHISPYIDKQTKQLIISWRPQSTNESAYICRSRCKSLFNENFFAKIFDSWRIPVPNFKRDYDRYVEVDASHLLHYQTQTAILTRKSGRYLEIKCQSKYDCRMRALALLLLAYRFNRKSLASVFPKEYLNLTEMEIQVRNPVVNNSAIFIFQKDSSQRVQALPSESKNYDVNSKFYINSDPNKKPLRYSTDLKIVMIQNHMQKSPQKVRPVVRSQSFHENPTFDVQNYLISDTKEIKLDQSVRNKKLQEERHYINNHYEKKRTFKYLKMEKKLKIKAGKKPHQYHEEFLLDNSKAPMERLTTQPELTHERSLGSLVYEDKQKNKREEKDRVQTIKFNSLIDASSKKRNIKNRFGESKSASKNLDDFTKNFINQGNFLQNQYLSGHYKRIRSEIEKDSVERVDRIRSQQSQWQQNLKKRKDQKKKYARQLQQQHKELLQKSNIEKNQELEKRKIVRTENSEPKSGNNKRNFKRVKVTFAQQCYPIIGRKPQDHSTN